MFYFVKNDTTITCFDVFEQILYSVNASPLHAFQQTEDVVGLLSSMVAVKFKDPLLLDRYAVIQSFLKWKEFSVGAKRSHTQQA